MSDYAQLLIHLVSDYWLQNDYMATNKKDNPNIALFHAMIYTIPFLLLTHSLLALGVICISHAMTSKKFKTLCSCFYTSTSDLPSPEK